MKTTLKFASNVFSSLFSFARLFLPSSLPRLSLSVSPVPRGNKKDVPHHYLHSLFLSFRLHIERNVKESFQLRCHSYLIISNISKFVQHDELHLASSVSFSQIVFLIMTTLFDIENWFDMNKNNSTFSWDLMLR